MKALGYIRVSRVGGREGDSFISPAEQRKAIEALAERDGFTVVEYLEELDASGGDNTRPKWNEAIERVESGEVQILAVWNLSRFSRSITDALKAIERIEAAGGMLCSAAGDAGDDSTSGRLTRNLFLAIAQMERERARDGFAAAQASALDRGIAITSKIPFGYRRDPETRKLEVEEEKAALIRQLFEHRAEGWSWNRLARWWADASGEAVRGNALQYRIENRTYLGEVNYGEHHKTNAHPAIVSRLLFDKANAVHGRRPESNGRLASQALMAGLQLVRCHSCGGCMQVASSKGEATYACRHPHCTSRASIKARRLDSEIVERLHAFWQTFPFAGTARTPGTERQVVADIAEAQTALETADYDLKLFAGNRENRRLLPVGVYNEELAALTENVSEAQIALEIAERAKAEPAKREGLADLWPQWTKESRREYLSKALSVVLVKSAARNSRIPIDERIAVGTDDCLWLHAKAGWSIEAFAPPVSALRFVSRSKARKSIAATSGPAGPPRSDRYLLVLATPRPRPRSRPASRSHDNTRAARTGAGATCAARSVACPAQRRAGPASRILFA